MIPYSAIQGYSVLRASVSDAALADLSAVMGSVASESTVVQREALRELVPLLGDQYSEATSMVAAEFYAELQSLQEIRKPVAPEILPLTDRKRWRSLVDWSADDYVFQHLGPSMVYSRLAGGITKTLTETAADTMIGNAEV